MKILKDGKFIDISEVEGIIKKEPITAEQLFEYLNFIGFISKETGYEPRKE